MLLHDSFAIRQHELDCIRRGWEEGARQTKLETVRELEYNLRTNQ